MKFPDLRVDLGSHSFKGQTFAKEMGTWLFFVVGAYAPYIVLRNVYPTRLLKDAVDPHLYYDISNYLISDLNFVGVALVVAYVPKWLGDIRTTRVSRGRRNFLNFLRACVAVSALLCLAQHATLHQELVIAPKNFYQYGGNGSATLAKQFLDHNSADVLERKYYIFWNLVAIVVGTFLSAFAAHPIVERRALP